MLNSYKNLFGLFLVLVRKMVSELFRKLAKIRVLKNIPVGETTIATIPVKYRPYSNVRVMTIAPPHGKTFRVIAETTGNIKIYNYDTSVIESANVAVTFSYTTAT